MQSERPITPSTLSVKDLPWQILWDKEKCTLCGKCTAVCPVNAIELGVFRKRTVKPPLGFLETPASVYKAYYGIRQKTDPAYNCVGCAMCNIPCPNDGCEGMVVEKASKKGRKFYACNQYPECRFAMWDEPFNDVCPECGSHVLGVKRPKGEAPVLSCRKKGCGFKKPMPSS